MPGASESPSQIACVLTMKLARAHGWSAEVPVSELVRDAPVNDEQQARDVARNQLADENFIAYHPGRDAIWLDPPPTDDLADFLIQGCGYGQLKVEATLDSYL